MDLNLESEARFKIDLYHDGCEAGFIQLVVYYDNLELPHIEYWLAPEYRRLGIMSRELPKYLGFCNSLEYRAFVALVKKDNAASQKLLIKNKFTKIAARKDNIEVYIFSPKLNKMAKEIMDLNITIFTQM